jgi:hypothetical protein
MLYSLIFYINIYGYSIVMGMGEGRCRVLPKPRIHSESESARPERGQAPHTCVPEPPEETGRKMKNTEHLLPSILWRIVPKFRTPKKIGWHGHPTTQGTQTQVQNSTQHKQKSKKPLLIKKHPYSTTIQRENITNSQKNIQYLTRHFLLSSDIPIPNLNSFKSLIM